MVDTLVDTSWDSEPGHPPGTIWKHSRSGRYYWRISRRFLPQKQQGKAARPTIPLVPTGRTMATRSKRLAIACQRRLWKEFAAGGEARASASVNNRLAEFRAWNEFTRGSSADQSTRNERVVRDFAGAHTLRVGDDQTISVPELARLHDISAQRVERFLAVVRQRPRTARTVQAYRNSLHLFCRWAATQGYIDSNPVACVQVAAPAKKPPRFLDDATRLAFLRRLHVSDVPAWLRAASLVALYAGPRLSSLRMLTWQGVGSHALTVPLSKQGDYCIIPLDEPIIGPELHRVLRGMTRGKRTAPVFPAMEPWEWGKHLSTITAELPIFGELEGRRAGNQWHLLRSTWAVTCARRGATLWQLLSWGGWKSPHIVTRYVNMAQAAKRLTPKAIRGAVVGYV